MTGPYSKSAATGLPGVQSWRQGFLPGRKPTSRLAVADGGKGAEPTPGKLTLYTTMATWCVACVEEMPEFQGNVKAVRTDELVDLAAAAIYPEWRERFEEWEKVGGDFGYHYMGSAIWFSRIGTSFGEAMLELKEADESN